MTEVAAHAPRSRSVSAPALLLAAVGFIELALLLAALAMGAEGGDILVLLLAFITIWVGAGPILVNMVQRPEKRQILITLITAVYVIYLVVPVFTNYFFVGTKEARGPFDLTTQPAEDIVHAQVVALTGLSMLLLGFYLPFGRLAASAFPKPTRDWPPHAALLIGLITLAVGWLVYIPGQLGFIPRRAGSGALGALASGSYFGIAVFALAWLRHRRPEALVLLGIVIPLSLLINFFTGSKRMFLAPFFVLGLSYIVYERRIRLSWLAAGFAMLVVLYPMSNFYRAIVNPVQGGRLARFVDDPGDTLAALSQFTGNVDDLGEYVSTGLQSTGRRLDGLAVLTKIVKDTPERVPYQGGWTIGYIALSYVPRIIWASKPDMTIGTWVSQNYGSRFDTKTHVGPTWMGELFFNWGYGGVVIGMFVIGVLCRILQERLFSWNAPIPALMGATVVLYAVAQTVQSGLIGPVNGTIYNLTPILFAHFLVGLVTGFQRSGAPARPHGDSQLSQPPAHAIH